MTTMPTTDDRQVLIRKANISLLCENFEYGKKFHKIFFDMWIDRLQNFSQVNRFN